MDDAIRVVIAEDSAVLRDGLVELLGHRGFRVAAAVERSRPALAAAIAADPPDVAVVDIRMPPPSPTRVSGRPSSCGGDHPGLGILLFSQYVETRYAAELLAGGAAGIGYLLKDRVADVERLRRGPGPGRVGGHGARPRGRDPAARGVAAHRLPDPPERARDARSSALMAEGRTNGAIATTLVVSEGAVEKHVANIFAKLGLAASPSDHRRVLAVLRFLEG